MSILTTNHTEINMDELKGGSDSAIDESTERNYGIWKKNTPFLYDYICTNSLLWPSTAVQFLPDLETPVKSLDVSEKTDDDAVLQRLLVGTFTLGMGVDSISIYQVPYYQNLKKKLNVDKLNYNSEKQEFELSTVAKKSLVQLQKINHRGDVNKLRYMPQNPDVIASANNYGDLYVYDRTKHSNVMNSINTDINKPQLVLGSGSSGPTDIFAIDWNCQKEGTIVSGNMNGILSVYDIKSGLKTKDTSVVDLSSTFSNENVAVNDVEWLPQHDAMFFAVDDVGKINLYDTRANKQVLSHHLDDGINSLSINSQNQTCFSTGDVNGKISIWDVRSFGSGSILSLAGHQDSVTQLKWHPKFHNVLASSSTDRLVNIYDVSNSETIFSHKGHMLGVNDFDWSLHEDWMIASVSDDNSLHVWKPTQSIVRTYV